MWSGMMTSVSHPTEFLRATDVRVRDENAHAIPLACAILTWILRDFGHHLDFLPGLDGCNEAEDKQQCIGKESVLRLTGATFLFFITHAISLIMLKDKADVRRFLHNSCWIVQLGLWVLFAFVAFVIPSGVFVAWGWLARFLAGAYLVFQLVIFIDWVYRSNEYLLNRSECLPVLAGGSLIFYGIALVFIIVGGSLYAKSGGCGVQIFWLVFTPLLGLVVSGLSLSPWRVESAGLFTASFVCMYAAWLLIAAMSSLPNTEQCTRPNAGDGWIGIIGFFVTIAAVCISTGMSGTQGEGFGLDLEDDSEEDVPYRPDFFHLMFALASAYLAMIFTGWSLRGTPQRLEVGTGQTSAWIIIVTQWVCYAMYGWTVVAPEFMQGRDFT